MSSRRFFVQYRSQQKEVFPFGTNAFKYKWPKDPDQIFKRKLIDGSLIFINDTSQGIDDFDFFKAIELTGGCCEEIKIRVDVDCNGSGYLPEWYGYFTTWVGKFDFDRCRFEVNAEPDDKYRCILENWETVFNMFDYPIITTQPIGTYHEEVGDTTGGSCCDLIEHTADAATIYAWWTGGGYGSAAAMIADGWCVKDQALTPFNEMWKFDVADTTDYSPCDVITFYNSLGAALGTARLCRIEGNSFYVKDLQNMGGVPQTTSAIIVAAFGTGGSPGHIDNGAATTTITSMQLYTQPFSTVSTTWHREEITTSCVSGICTVPPGGGWILTDPCSGGLCGYARCPLGEEVKYRGTLWLDMIEAILQELCPAIPQLTSIFFDHNPDTSDVLYSPGINYMTGAASAVDALLISHRTDVIDTTATNPAHAPAGNLTLKQMFEWAREVFNVYWDILPNGKLRMEHFNYFKAFQVIDLTAAQYAPYASVKNAYTHNREPIPSFEQFQWQDAEKGAIDFLGKNIIYSGSCATRDKKVDHAPSLLSTDLPYLTNNPELSRSDEGFVMIATQLYLGDYVVRSEVGILTAMLLPNAHLSWANLHQNYHRWNRYLPSGNMNDIATTFISWKPNVKQVDITIPVCCTIPNPEGYAMTELATIIPALGMINSMEQSFKPDTLKLSLEYSLPCGSS